MTKFFEGWHVCRLCHLFMAIIRRKLARFLEGGKGLVILMEAFEGGVGGGKSVSNSMAASVAACCI